MSLSIWNDSFFVDPWKEMKRIQSEMDNLFERSLQPSPKKQKDKTWFSPAMDYKETENEYQIHAELPGCTKENINLEVNNGSLIISGEKKEEKKEITDKLHRVERRFGHFSRTLPLPEGVTEDKVKAKFDNGVLQISFPKPVKEVPKPKMINIE